MSIIQKNFNGVFAIIHLADIEISMCWYTYSKNVYPNNYLYKMPFLIPFALQ